MQLNVHVVFFSLHALDLEMYQASTNLGRSEIKLLGMETCQYSRAYIKQDDI